MFGRLDRYLQDGGQAVVLWYGDGDFPVPPYAPANIRGGLSTKHRGLREALMTFSRSMHSNEDEVKHGR